LRRRARDHPARRIARRTDDDEPRPRRYRREDGIRIEGITALRIEREARASDAVDLRDLCVDRKRRLDHEHFVARRIEQRTHRNVHGFLRTRRDADVVGVPEPRVGILRGNGLAQFQIADVRRIATAVRCDPARRGFEVGDVRCEGRLSDPEIDRCRTPFGMQRADRRSVDGCDRRIHTATPKSRIALSRDVLRSVEAVRSPITSAHGTL